jgi:hypothetical protein
MGIEPSRRQTAKTFSSLTTTRLGQVHQGAGGLVARVRVRMAGADGGGVCSRVIARVCARS